MYFPYLRGRQFELIALREYAHQHGIKNNIVPIIEPVRQSFNSMKLALPILIEENIKFALILNPQVGEIIENEKTIVEALKEEISDSVKWVPAFIISSNYNEIAHQIKNYNYKGVMIICSDSTDSSNNDFEKLVFSDEVKYIVSKENRTLKRTLSRIGKDFIRLDDCFKAQKQNKDYLAISEEKFTEEHLFYIEDGYQGFADYTSLESDFKEGGAAPYAVAIHLTYQKENKEIWIRHFVSESNEGRANIQGKFAEAASKAVEFLDMQNIHNYASEELRKYYNNGNGTYPGLGMVKKISIKNHLELINGVLS